MLCATAIHAEFVEYISPGTGKVINSRDAQRDDLKRSGAFLAEPGIEKDVERNKLALQEKTFAPIAEGIDRAVSGLVSQRIIES